MPFVTVDGSVSPLRSYASHAAECGCDDNQNDISDNQPAGFSAEFAEHDQFISMFAIEEAQ